MSDLFSAPAPVVEAPIAEVVTLHPDGVFLRQEGAVYWVERRRGARWCAAVAYDADELRQLRDALVRLFGAP